MTDWLTGALWFAGAAFSMLAALGLWRMPDLYTRMQASTKAQTLGLACLLAGTALQFPDLPSVVKAISVGAFVMLTSPVATHVIARSAYHTRVALWHGTIDERRDDRGGAGAP